MFLTIQLHNAIPFFLLFNYLVIFILTSPTLFCFIYLPQLCDFGFARAMSTNTVVLRSIKGKLLQLFAVCSIIYMVTRNGKGKFASGFQIQAFLLFFALEGSFYYALSFDNQ